LRGFINLLLYRSGAELRSEGTRTYAGYLWWILEPLMSLGVYYFAFKYIFHRETESFVIFLFIGIVTYRFFSGTVTRSASSISSGQGLMQLVYVHKSIFPLSVVTVSVVKFLITLLLVVVVTWLAGIAPTWSYLAMPILIALELLLTAGVSMVWAAITPFFPDFQLILATLMHLWATNPIESTFATVRLRTARTKGSGSRTACLTMVLKLAQCAERHWCRLNGKELIAEVIGGIKSAGWRGSFVNGIKEIAA
jgi:hypothetical protein